MMGLATAFEEERRVAEVMYDRSFAAGEGEGWSMREDRVDEDQRERSWRSAPSTAIRELDVEEEREREAVGDMLVGEWPSSDRERRWERMSRSRSESIIGVEGREVGGRCWV